jgi:transposase
MSKTTITALDQRSAPSPVLMMAFELGETGWLLGFSTGFGQQVLRRKVPSRDREGVLRAIAWAQEQLGCENASVASCYEAGRDGFWLHRWLVSEGIENRIIDSSSIEVNRRKKRAKTDRLDVTKLVSLLARYLAGEREAFSIVSVPSVADEDLRQLGRELKLLKKDRTRISHRMKGLLANQGLVIDLKKDLREQIDRMRLWNGKPLPEHLRERLLHYREDFAYHTQRIRGLEQRRRELMRAKESAAVEKAWKLFLLRGVGIESSWSYGTEFFG